MTLQWHGVKINKGVEAAVRGGLVLAAKVVEAEARRLILETRKSGRIYNRRGKKHQASAPGEPPASDTGKLVKSIRVDTAGLFLLHISVRAEAPYFAHLEYGTQHMAARPFARVALSNKRLEVELILARSIRSFLARRGS